MTPDRRCCTIQRLAVIPHLKPHALPDARTCSAQLPLLHSIQCNLCLEEGVECPDVTSPVWVLCVKSVGTIREGYCVFSLQFRLSVGQGDQFLVQHSVLKHT